MAGPKKTYVVEHLDEELGSWSELEYITISKESHNAEAAFCLSSIPPSLQIPAKLKEMPGFTADTRSVELLYATNKSRVCLLDPAAAQELSIEDGEKFDVFLFGGILGKIFLHCCRVCVDRPQVMIRREVILGHIEKLVVLDS